MQKNKTATHMATRGVMKTKRNMSQRRARSGGRRRRCSTVCYESSSITSTCATNGRSLGQYSERMSDTRTAPKFSLQMIENVDGKNIWRPSNPPWSPSPPQPLPLSLSVLFLNFKPQTRNLKHRIQAGAKEQILNPKRKPSTESIEVKHLFKSKLN